MGKPEGHYILLRAKPVTAKQISRDSIYMETVWTGVCHHLGYRGGGKGRATEKV